MVIQTICDKKQTVQENITVRSVTLAGLSVKIPNKPVSFQGQSETFNQSANEFYFPELL